MLEYASCYTHNYAGTIRQGLVGRQGSGSFRQGSGSPRRGSGAARLGSGAARRGSGAARLWYINNLVLLTYPKQPLVFESVY